MFPRTVNSGSEFLHVVVTGMHCAKHYRPFELFLNENYRLRMN